MEEINWQNFKCRCSAIAKMLAGSRSNPVLTENQVKKLEDYEKKESLTENQKIELADLQTKRENGKKIILSDGCISYLMEEYAWQTQGMVRITKELEIVQMDKGKSVELESVALLCMVDDITYNYNSEKDRVYSEYLSGELDVWLGETMMSATVIPDIKSVWDYPTFLCKLNEACSPDNDWQVKGYMDISGAREGFIADCLIDTPQHIVDRLKWQLLNKMNVATEESPEFKERWAVLERSMKFSHIPPAQRVNKKKVEPMTEFEQQKVYDRVKVCREWLNSFHETYQKLNMKLVSS